MEKRTIVPAEGKLGVLLPGMGAVATTFIAGVMLARRRLALPIGSLTQMGRIRLGLRTENRNPLIREFVPLAELDDLVFGGWDIYPDSAYEAAVHAKVLEAKHLDPIKDELGAVVPMQAVFDRDFVKRLDGPWKKSARTKMELAEQLRDDIRRFRSDNKLARLVMVWCGSTEVYAPPAPVHQSLEAFELGLQKNDPAIAPSMIYAYAALMEGVPYVNGSPNYSVDTPALIELAKKSVVPIAGKDFKTGQTLVKTVLGPMFRARALGVRGWFSTNILGNRDGEVLDDPGSFRAKEVTKGSVLDEIMDPNLFPDLYAELHEPSHHKVRIEYYPPRGDAKEGWDNIDLFGWLGYPMQIKVNFLCRDSILAAPIVLDLALLTDLAARAGLSGIQEWLGFYFKSPMTAEGLQPKHALHEQEATLLNTLRWMMGERLIHGLGQVYYGEEE